MCNFDTILQKKSEHMKKNNFLLLGMLILLNLTSQAQTFKLHAEYKADWYGPGYVLSPDIPGYPSITLQADSIGDKFVIEADNSFNKWKNQGSDPLTYLNVPDTFVFIPNASSVPDNMLSVPTIIGHYYTTRLRNLGYQSTRAVVMKTTLLPAGILSVSQSPSGNPASGTQVALTITTGTRSPEEHFYVRYSTNNFSTSEVAEFVFQGPNATSGIASIPSGLTGSTTSYYIFSSTIVLQNGANNIDYDLITLKQNNNQNQNYAFTAVNPVATAAITFRVNMSSTTISNQGVRLTGSFFNWSLDSAQTIMTSVGNGVFEKTISLDTTLTIQYKFINGSTFQQQENVPQACGISNGVGGFDRQIAVPNAPAVLPTVCFGSCSNCPLPVFVPVTFRVNMSLVPTVNQVRLTGSFVNWSLDSTTLMTNIGNGVFEKTVNLDTTQVVQYKFINGASFANEENVPSACGVPNNVNTFDRQIAVPNAPAVLPTVCFGSCSNCALPVFVPVTFRVDMSETPAGPDGVRLAGSFNNWSLGDSSLMNTTGNGIYAKTLSLDTSLIVQYKFVNGLTFQVQENVPQSCGVPDGFQGFNRTLSVPNAATTLPAVCFSSCAACLSVNSKVSTLSAVKLFPNPAAEELFLQNLQGVQQIEVFNTSGQKVYVSQPESTDILRIPVAGFATGVYVVRITLGSDVSWHKFSKQ
jgi:hypothetical protein